MKKILLVVVTLTAGVVIGALGLSWYHATSPGPSEIGDGGERKILYYRNPMNPAITSDRPSKDSMGMDYIPVYAGEVPVDDSVPGFNVSPEKIQRIGVKSAPVERRVMRHVVRAVGRVDYDETRLAVINAKISGWVERLLVDQTGRVVRKGQPLLQLYSPDLVSTQQEYILALEAAASGVKGSEDLVRSAEQRLRYWDIPEHEILMIARSKTPSKTLALASPVTGVVIDKPVIQGTAVSPGETLYKIADLSSVWIYTDIYEYELAGIHVGQEARVTLTSYPDRVFHGRVVYVYPYLDPETRTVKVRIELKNPVGIFKPEMYANVEIVGETQSEVLAVPESSVIDTGIRRVVLLDHGNGRFEPKEIEIGVRADGWVEIRKGLAQGETVVTSANFLIDSESNLRAALAGFGEKTPSLREGPSPSLSGKKSAPSENQSTGEGHAH